jgi:tyrosine-protein kinase Etk/Wzc
VDSALEERLQSLRGRIETDLVRPSIIVVTSAAPGEGKSLMAFGLAHSLAQAGYKAVVVDTNHANPEVRGGPSVADMRRHDAIDVSRLSRKSDRFGGVEVIPLSDRLVQISASKELVETLSGQLRFAYDFTVVDTTRLSRSHMGLLFANCSDGVLVCVRHGRARCADDGFAARQLERIGIRKVWAVRTTSNAIKQFARERTGMRDAVTHLRSDIEPVNSPNWVSLPGAVGRLSEEQGK